MSKVFQRKLVALGAVILAAAAPCAHSQRNLAVNATEQRVALVVGNSAYKDSPLTNPVNDATDVAATLRSLGFRVTLKTNASNRQMISAINDFGQALKQGGVGVFYFAGHGVQSRGRNYLVPVGAAIQSEAEVEFETVDANRVLALMDEAGNRVNIVILDACRNNPFARSFRSASRGLAQMEAAKGSYVAFATAPGSVASDGAGRNGLYTEHLLRNLRAGDSDIDKVFRRVAADVSRATSGKQVPWTSSSLTGDFSFRASAGESAQAVAASARPAVPGSEPAAMELALWETVKDSRSPEELKAYLDQYPEGRFAGVARARLKAVTAAGAPTIVSTASPQTILTASPTLRFNRDPATGTEIAVVSGNPGQSGQYVMRVRSPASWKSMPHRHPNDIQVTVVSGVMRFAEGEQFDQSRLRDYPAGSSLLIPANMPHYDFSPVAAEFQVEGSGPLRTVLVGPAAGPQTATQQRGDTYFLDVHSAKVDSPMVHVLATKHALELERLGFRPRMEPVDIPGKGTLYRVRIGPYTKLDEVEAVRKKLAANRLDAAIAK